ncbi:hypothetical protein CLG96_12595 [Sphingomonas oleivorans]|uniref:Uncharacterized protein n=1 Tax=Sphingomonas oleivorans TaxID=1735121 RepID=A0A2T5FW19_9SPHN|nr:hypothetical protein CLG96_12595 [Sphingomonas oleivorans]
MEDGLFGVADLDPVGARPARRRIFVDTIDTIFSALERKVIHLAGRAPLVRGAAPLGRLGRLVATLFGMEPETPLADPRLEGLRRFASLARHRPRAISAEEVETFLGHGFTINQLRVLRSHFADGGIERGLPGIA